MDFREKTEDMVDIDLRVQLQKWWGYGDFRPPQGEIVQCAIDRRDALVVMPTGGGKSICFQLPALLVPGLTIVISPLVALMENQVAELAQKGIAAGSIHGELPAVQRRGVLAAIEKQTLKMLYLSPETLLSQPVWSRLCRPECRIANIIIDEAHCLVQWGDTFRPEYRRLGAVRAALLKDKPQETIAIAAFTATADNSACQTIAEVLQLKNPARFILDPYRNNLFLKIDRVWTPHQRRQKLADNLHRQGKACGLVYARTRRDCEELAAWLREKGKATAAYHAGLSPSERRQLETAWLEDTLQFVVCTCAFGMGINKPDVRWVIHYHPPLLLAEYLQEIGRGGRDGKPSLAILLACEPTGCLYPDDKQRREFFIRRLAAQTRAAIQLAPTLPDRGNVAEVTRDRREANMALAILHRQGSLIWQDPFNFVRRSTSQPTATNWEEYNGVDRYLRTKDCRWSHLLAAYGQPRYNWRCGHCDRCRDLS